MIRNYKLIGLDCANCAMKMEKKVSTIEGINSVTINFMTAKMILDMVEENTEAIIENVTKAVNSVERDVKLKRI